MSNCPTNEKTANSKEQVICAGRSSIFEPCSSGTLRDSTSKLLKHGQGTKSCLQDNLLIEKLTNLTEK